MASEPIGIRDVPGDSHCELSLDREAVKVAGIKRHSRFVALRFEYMSKYRTVET